MRTIYLDIFSGISGDMFIGAMLDLGVDFNQLTAELQKLGLEEYHLHAGKAARAQITGTKFDVHLEHDHAHDDDDHDHPHHHDHEHEHRHEHEHEHEHEHHHVSHQHGHSQKGHAEAGLHSPSSHAHSHHGHGHSDLEHEHEHAHGHQHEHEHEHGRTFAEIRELIGRSSLSGWVKDKSVGIFQRIATAEGRIHGQAPDHVHFHEVGAVDSIVDIVGACIALELLGRPRVVAGPVVEGTGFIHCAHGRFPIPAPATLEILTARGIPISQCDEPHELVTPTGAAILAEMVEEFGLMKQLRPERVGYGIGTRENRTRPNVLRAVLGKAATTTASPAYDWETDTIAVLQTNLDDISAEVLGGFMERALAAGALDVFHTPVQMKKNRPGVLLTVLCPEEVSEKLAELILRETSAFGLRRFTAERRKLRRETKTVNTSMGPVSVKVGRLNGKVVQAAPEFESCREAAVRAGVPLKQVYEEALRRYVPDSP
jgi:uncharacterized protein (TIGR00299 family) protein